MRITALLAWLLCASAALADERILSFDAVVTVNADRTIDVRETLRVRSEGDRIRRGIYRDFLNENTASPTGGRVALSYEFYSVQRDGKPEPSFSRHENGAIRLYVGRAGVNVPSGEHTYELAC